MKQYVEELFKSYLSAWDLGRINTRNSYGPQNEAQYSPDM
jgi:hypothetical protein